MDATVREIPINSVVILQDVVLRFELDRERIDTFKELYLEEEQVGEEKLPPIRVFLLQAGNAKDAKYALSEGHHRYTSRKELKKSTVRAYIYVTPSFTIADIDSAALKKEILKDGCTWNSKTAKDLTREERITAAKKLYNKYGSTIDEIVATGIAPRSTVHLWLKEDIQEKKHAAGQQREGLRAKIKELIDKGTSKKGAAKQVGIPRQTLQDLLRKSRNAGHGEGAGKSNTGLSGTLNCEAAPVTEPGRGAARPPSTAENEEEKADGVIRAIFELISNVTHTEYIEDRMRLHLLPLLQRTYPTIDNLIASPGDTSEIYGLRADYKAVYEALKIANLKIVEQDGDLKSKKETIDSLTKKCRESCPHTYKRLRDIHIRYCNFIVARVKEHVQLLSFFAGDTAERFKEVTLKLILPALSVFEWASHEGTNLTTPETIGLFEELADVINASELINPRISARIRETRKYFALAFPGVEEAAVPEAGQPVEAGY
jgi:hypothetical protein